MLQRIAWPASPAGTRVQSQRIGGHHCATERAALRLWRRYPRLSRYIYLTHRLASHPFRHVISPSTVSSSVSSAGWHLHCTGDVQFFLLVYRIYRRAPTPPTRAGPSGWQAGRRRCPVLRLVVLGLWKSAGACNETRQVAWAPPTSYVQMYYIICRRHTPRLARRLPRDARV